MLYTFLLVAMILSALLMMFNLRRTALSVALLSIGLCAAYRWSAGEELRAFGIELLVCLALLPIGWWGAKQFSAPTVRQE